MSMTEETCNENSRANLFDSYLDNLHFHNGIEMPWWDDVHLQSQSHNPT